MSLTCFHFVSSLSIFLLLHFLTRMVSGCLVYVGGHILAFSLFAFSPFPPVSYIIVRTCACTDHAIHCVLDGALSK